MDQGCEVLIPTRDRPAALAVTLSGIAAQSHAPTRLLVADQSRDPVAADPVVAAMTRVLDHHGVEVEFHHRKPRGIAEQRAFLLSRARAPQVLFVDDDVWLEPWSIATLRRALRELGCGYVGMAVTGLSYLDDHRPQELGSFQPWDGAVQPEEVRPDSPAWARHQLHNAANPVHLAAQAGATPEQFVAYQVAWVGGCVLFDREALQAVGGYSFWPDLPVPHAGEDVLAQLRVQRRFGAAGILPSGAVHLELSTTIPQRPYEAYRVVGP